MYASSVYERTMEVFLRLKDLHAMVRFVKVYIRLQAQIKFASAREALQRCKSRFKRKKKRFAAFCCYS